MEYQVWIKDEYGEGFTKVDCGDLPAAKRELDLAVRTGREPILTQELPYELSIKVGELGAEVPKVIVNKRVALVKVEEDAKSEATKGGPEGDQSSRG